MCFFSCVIFVRVCVCENEGTLGGDSRYLGPTDRHLALHQPSTTRPYGMLRNVTSWHRQSNAGVRACGAPLSPSARNASTKPVENYVHKKKNKKKMWRSSFFFLYHRPHVQTRASKETHKSPASAQIRERRSLAAEMNKTVNAYKRAVCASVCE